MRELVRSLIRSLEAGRELIVCQVVETKGSTPQKAGAMMLVDPEGGQVGTLGGGCVENEVKLKALRRFGQTGAEIHAFVLDHDYAWADGLICGGKMVIAVESARSDQALAYYRAYRDRLEAGTGYTEAIVVEPGQLEKSVLGGRCLFDAEGRPVASWNAETVIDRIAARLQPLADRPKPGVRAGVALLPTLPRVRLVIVGAGHVGQAVGNLAAQADFDVHVVDDRALYANRDRFPTAERLIVGPLEETLPNLTLDRHTYAIIVTRGHGHDQEALFHLAPTDAAYVGLIGSRRKIKLIFESLREQGIAESALTRVSAPLGIEIGSQSVIEIAISIVAELIARRNLGTPWTQTSPSPAEAAEA